MHYTIRQLAELAGVSTRTLRWYDRLGLLQPSRQDNGYRSYGPAEVDQLQQILFYRELGFSLDDIADVLQSEDFDATAALRQHLIALKERRERLDGLINTVEQTMVATEKGAPMSDKEKFEAFKQKALKENEERYGAEIREKYGEETVKASNAKFAGLSEEQYAASEALQEEFMSTLTAAFEQGDPNSELAAKAAQLHKEWLCYFWPKYTPEQHKGVTQMYVDDERFTAYYDKLGIGITKFLRDAVWAWLG